MKKIKVYSFISDNRVGGQVVYAETIKSKLNGLFDIYNVSPSSLAHIKVFNLRRYFSILYFIDLALNLIKLLFCKYNQPLVFDVHGVINLAPILVAKFRRIPVVWHIHETTQHYLIFFKLGQYLLPKRHEIVVVAKRCVEAYDIQKFNFIPPSVDKNWWYKDTNHKSLSKKKNVINLLLVANLNPIKGVDILINSLSDLLGNWNIRIIGGELSTQKKYIRDLKLLADKIRHSNPNITLNFLGYRDQDFIKKELSHCDAFVLPSRSEASPISLLQAISMDCFCIASDVGDVKEMLSCSIGYILFDSDSVDSCKNALDKFHSLFFCKSQRMRLCPEWEINNFIYKHSMLYKKFL